jgi:hypothetical protein
VCAGCFDIHDHSAAGSVSEMFLHIDSGQPSASIPRSS